MAGQKICVAPITHKPRTDTPYIEIPMGYLHEAGLDGQGCYLVVNEMNTFTVPNPDPDFNLTLKGQLPEGFLEKVRTDLKVRRTQALLRDVDRDEIARQTIEDYRNNEWER